MAHVVRMGGSKRRLDVIRTFCNATVSMYVAKRGLGYDRDVGALQESPGFEVGRALRRESDVSVMRDFGYGINDCVAKRRRSFQQESGGGEPRSRGWRAGRPRLAWTGTAYRHRRLS
jgi:hypothetical protein